MTPARALPRAVAAVLGVVVALLLGAAPAAAHGGEGQVEITGQRRDGDDVTVVARVAYVDDGHAVPDATVTVVVDDGTPVPMQASAQEGLYEATVPAAPGATIRVTSVDPTATAEATAVEAAATTTEAATTTAPEATTTEPEATTEADADEEEAAGTTPTPVPDEEAEDGSDDGANLVVIGAVVAVVGAAGVMAAILLWRRPGAGDDSAAGDRS